MRVGPLVGYDNHYKRMDEKTMRYLKKFSEGIAVILMAVTGLAGLIAGAIGVGLLLLCFAIANTVERWELEDDHS